MKIEIAPAPIPARCEIRSIIVCARRKTGFDKEKSCACRFAFVIRTQQRETLSSAARSDES